MRISSSGGASRSTEGLDAVPFRLEVLKNRQRVLSALLAIVFVPIGLLALFEGLRTLEPVPLLVGPAYLAMYAFILWLRRRADIRSVSYFSDEMLVRNDGQPLPWTKLSRVITQVHKGRIWRIEIHFIDNQSAWLIPRRVVNFAEVYGFVRRLPCDHAEVSV